MGLKAVSALFFVETNCRVMNECCPSSVRHIQEWYSLVEEARLTTEQAHQLQTHVKGQFHQWLDSTGHGREIRELELPRTTPSS